MGDSRLGSPRLEKGLSVVTDSNLNKSQKFGPAHVRTHIGLGALAVCICVTAPGLLCSVLCITFPEGYWENRLNGNDTGTWRYTLWGQVEGPWEVQSEKRRQREEIIVLFVCYWVSLYSSLFHIGILQVHEKGTKGKMIMKYFPFVQKLGPEMMDISCSYLDFICNKNKLQDSKIYTTMEQFTCGFSIGGSFKKSGEPSLEMI